MYRLYGAIAVMVIMLTTAGIGFYWNTNASNQVLIHLSEAYELVEAGQIESGQKALAEAAHQLTQHIDTMYLFVSHRKLDEIEQAMKKAEVSLERKEITAFLIFCKSAIELTQDFKNTEFPSFKNLL